MTTMNSTRRALRIGTTATALLVALAALAGAGCAAKGTGPYEPNTEANRDTVRAERLTQQAVEVMDKDPEKAEALLREALTADLYHGPAHNNLGVLYLKQSKLYDAAGEFEWARKLLPGHPDPRFNLALVLETAGRPDQALAMYDTALEVYPEHIATMQAVARLQLRNLSPDDRTRGFLDEIALRGETLQWQKWAQQQLAMHPGGFGTNRHGG